MTLRELLTLEDKEAVKAFLKRVYDTEHEDSIDHSKSIIHTWLQYKKSKTAGTLAKFMRLADSVTANNSESKNTTDGIGDFVVSVFLALEQPVNLDTDLETFYILHKSEVKSAKAFENE